MGDGAKRAIESIVPGDSVLSNYGAGDLASGPRDRVASRKDARDSSCCGASALRRRRQKHAPRHVHFAGYVLGETPQNLFLCTSCTRKAWANRLGTSQVYTEGQARPHGGLSSNAPYKSMPTALWIVPHHTSENEARIDEVLTSAALRACRPAHSSHARAKPATVFVHDAGHLQADIQLTQHGSICRTAAGKKRVWTSTGRTMRHRPQFKPSQHRHHAVAAIGAAAHRCTVFPW